MATTVDALDVFIKKGNEAKWDYSLVNDSSLSVAERSIARKLYEQKSGMLQGENVSYEQEQAANNFQVDRNAVTKVAASAFTSNPLDSAWDNFGLGTARKIAEQLNNQGQNVGVNWKNKAQSAMGNIGTLAQQLASKGVTDLTKLKVKDANTLLDTVTGKDVVFKTASGKNPFWSAKGTGHTKYGFQAYGDVPIFVPQWKSSSDVGKIMPLVGLGLNFLAPGLGAGIGSALGLSGAAATAVGSGILGSGMAAIGGARGSDIFKAGLASGVGSYIGSYAPAISKAVGGGKLGNFVGGATTGLVKSALLGGDPIRNLLLSSIGTLNPGSSLGLQGNQATAFNKFLTGYVKYKTQKG